MTPDDDTPSSREVEAANWVTRMQGERLGPDEARELARWLEDPGNARVYCQMEQVHGLSGSGAAAGRHARRHAMRKTRNAGLVLALAASLTAAAIGAGAWIGWLGPQVQDRRVRQDYASAIGELRTLRLSDGSTVRLDTGSRVRIAFSASARRLELLAGRARFEVAHDRARPFMVRADGQAIVAVGTIFDVRLDGNRVTVALIEGKVRVEEGRPDEPPRRVTALTAGQRLLAAYDQGAPAVSVSPGPDRWPERILSVKAASLRSVVDEANRYSRSQILIGDPALAETRVTTTLKLGDAGAVARTLATSLGLGVVRDPAGDWIIGDGD